MPGFDRTGPSGAGPMTGGRRGLCNPATAGNSPVYGGYGYGRGLGLRRGFRGGNGPGSGRGYGWHPSAAAPFYPSVSPMAGGGEIDMLKEHAGKMKNALDAINRRIDELEKQSPEPA